MKVASEAVDWPRNGRPRVAGVSSFGISGTNAHVVLEEAPEPPASSSPERATELVVLSAKTAEALQDAATHTAAHLEAHPEFALGDVAYSLATRRTPPRAPPGVVGSPRAPRCSRRWPFGARRHASRGAPRPRRGEGRPRGCSSSRAKARSGSAWGGSCSPKSLGVPRRDGRVRRRDRQGDGVVDARGAAGSRRSARGSTRSTSVQPALFAIGAALAALWRSWGIEPHAVVGHSQGEVAAAYVAGALSLEDAAAVICRRSRLLRAIVGKGEMALVQLLAAEAQAAARGVRRAS